MHFMQKFVSRLIKLRAARNNMPSIKSLGDSLPKIISGAGGNFGGGGATGSWDLPSISTKAAELGDKIINTDIAGIFSKAVVNISKLEVPLQGAIKGLFDKTETGVPSNFVPEKLSTNDLKVSIKQFPEIDGSPNELVFNVMPKIDENRSVDYEQITPVGHPGAILKYKNSSIRTWDVSGRLISRTMLEATLNLALINMIRAWAMPFYGAGTGESLPDLLGAPPPILTLKAYGNRMIGPVKCVLKSYRWSFDNALDYIDTEGGTPFPVILDINLTLDEAWSPAEYSGFNIVKYKNGDLGDDGAFANRGVSSTPKTSISETTDKASEPEFKSTAALAKSGGNLLASGQASLTEAKNRLADAATPAGIIGLSGQFNRNT